MTDNEIIKALEIHINEYDKTGISVDNNRLDKLALDLINRQKAEIEALKIKNQSLRSAANSYKLHYNEAGTEAIKEFAKRLKNSIYINTDLLTYQCEEVGSVIDDIVKEMVGETNDI